jgi:cytochrome c-type biogenesis protein CcmI
MGMLLGTALVLITVAVLVYPFLNRRKYTLERDPAVERLRVARLRVYRQIADLESDRMAGDLTQADYEAQFNELRIAAAKIMQREEQPGVAMGEEDLLEREIAAARQANLRPPEGGDPI